MVKLKIKKDSTLITIPDESDVESALNDKLDISDAFSGSYNDLSNKPTIPLKTSDLTNDGDGNNAFLTQHQSISGKEDTSNKVTSISSSSTDTQYPSAKCVYDAIGDADVNIQVIEEGTTITNDGIYLIIPPDNLIASVTGNSILMANMNRANWLIFENNSTQGVINWGDGTTTSIDTSTDNHISHSYTDSSSTHNITISDVTILADSCFKGCTGLTSVVIPNSVTSIDGECFSGCTGLTSVTIPNSVTYIGGGSFRECTSLTSITIPNGVTTLGSNCFRSCTGLTSVTIPNSVTNLGNSCFRSCTGLTSISIPSSVTLIGDYVFDGDNNILDCQLYWTGNNIPSYQSKWGIGSNSNSVITIPNGETSNYVAKGYPSAKLQERSA